MRFFRSYVGDPLVGGVLFGQYRFEWEVPEYEWQLNQRLGQQLVEWTQKRLEQMRYTLQKDARRADIPIEILANSYSWQCVGVGATEFDEEGNPIWQEHLAYSGMLAGWERFQKELLSRVRDIGDNDVGKTLMEGGQRRMFHPSSGQRPDSHPIVMLWKWLIVRVNTAEWGTLGRMAQELFLKGEERRHREDRQRQLAGRMAAEMGRLQKEDEEREARKYMSEGERAMLEENERVADEEDFKRQRRRLTRIEKRMLEEFERLAERPQAVRLRLSGVERQMLQQLERLARVPTTHGAAKRHTSRRGAGHRGKRLDRIRSRRSPRGRR